MQSFKIPNIPSKIKGTKLLLFSKNKNYVTRIEQKIFKRF